MPIEKKKPPAKYYFDLATYHKKEALNPKLQRKILPPIALGAIVGFAGLTAPSLTQENILNYNTDFDRETYALITNKIEAQKTEIFKLKEEILDIDRDIYTAKYNKTPLTEKEKKLEKRNIEQKYSIASQTYVDLLVKDPRITENMFKTYHDISYLVEALPHNKKNGPDALIRSTPSSLEECRLTHEKTDKILNCMQPKPIIALKNASFIASIAAPLWALFTLLLMTLTANNRSLTKPQRKNYIKHGN